MLWNWEKSDWPNFTYDAAIVTKLEEQFIYGAGRFGAALTFIRSHEREELLIDLITQEALKTSEIEGKILDRESLQSSLRRHFGLTNEPGKISAPEAGLSEMMVDLHRRFDAPLTKTSLLKWQAMLMRGRKDLSNVGKYRSGKVPMQVVSGTVDKLKIHFEAPPASRVAGEIAGFIRWFNNSASNRSLPALVRAAIAHHYFVTIHPFEDGNGRIARALAEKALSQRISQPALIALSSEIQKYRKRYYEALRQTNHTNEINGWIRYFSEVIVNAQQRSQLHIEFLLEKTKCFERLRGQLNSRQEKVLARIFREGPEGFRGGMSAEKYIRLTRTSRATATRDLQDLVKLKVLRRQGERKHTRYFLNLAQVKVRKSPEVVRK